MPLSESDKALLQLFLEGGLDYSAAGSVLGRPADSVADGARAALDRISGAPEPLPPAIADWLLGQADPIAEADALTAIESNPGNRRLAVVTSSALRLMFPDASIPQIPSAGDSSAQGAAPRDPPPLPGASDRVSSQPASPTPPFTDPEPPRVAPPAPSPAGSSPPVTPPAVSPAPREPLSTRIAARLEILTREGRRRPALIAVGSASALLIIIAAAVLVFGGGGKQESGPSSDGGTATLVPLTPTSAGSQGQGRAVLVSSGDAAIVQVNLAGLRPTSSGENYVLWLYRSPGQAYPLARDRVGDAGRLTGPAPVPQDLTPPLREWGCVELTLASRSQIARSLRSVASRGTGPAVGKSVLRGEIAPADRTPRTGSASICDPNARG